MQVWSVPICAGGAKLREGILVRAHLTQANLCNADLTAADCTEAVVGATIFGETMLRNAVGLETCIHHGRSVIDLATIVASDNLPTAFLRGCGCPERVIKHLPSLAEPGQFYSCFISHSSEDRAFADQLHGDLQDVGVRCWYFWEDAKWGEPLWEEIDQNIRGYDKLIVICSEISLQSGPVLREVERVLQREDAERKSILLPITIDNHLFNTWKHPRKADVLAKVVGDFRKWDADARRYRAGIARLLRALQRRADK